jgi:hypothetical protein
VKISRVRFEHLQAPLGIGTGTPRISWQISDIPAGWEQTGYEIEVRDLDAGPGQPSLHGVESVEQILVPWPAGALRSQARAEVRVHVLGRTLGHGRGTGDLAPSDSRDGDAWSAPVVVEDGAQPQLPQRPKRQDR